VSKDIEDVENEKDGIKRNENQVDNTGCYPLFHREGRCLVVLFKFGWKRASVALGPLIYSLGIM
jgi:hypothetical protein